MKPAIFVPVKGSSERIPSKNLKLLDGKPLFLHTLEKLSFHHEFFDVFLDTESEEVIKLSSHLESINILRRDPALATNKTDGNKLFMNEVKACKNEIIIQHLCTSPFIEISTIKKCISCLGDYKHDSALLVKKEKQYTWKDNYPLYNIDNIPNSKDLPDITIETMGLYVVPRKTATSLNRRIGSNPYLVNASPLEAFDVNWPNDFDMAQLIAAGKRESERKLFDNISLLTSSAMLSDILDDLNLGQQVIKSLGYVTGDFKSFLGPAKTLRLRKMRSDDHYEGIYDALAHYETIVSGDVICVENEAPEYAYFGELNANLAIRQGARGVVVGGKTRDHLAVQRTGLPVFSSGYTCQDVRKRAVFESLNREIKIDNVSINPGDLIFADSEGIVAIPRKNFAQIVELIIEKTKNESNILADICSGIDIDKLRSDRGDF